MMKFKTGKCKMCAPNRGEQLLYAKGLCHFHYWNTTNKATLAKKNTQNRLVNPISQNVDSLTLVEYFNYHIQQDDPSCDNCGIPLIFYNRNIAISCQAHIVPKEFFKSVMSNIHNHLTLGGLNQKCKCHGQYDSNWKNAQKMPVIEIVKTKFLLFKNDIAKSEIRRLPEFLKALF